MIIVYMLVSILTGIPAFALLAMNYGVIVGFLGAPFIASFFCFLVACLSVYQHHSSEQKRLDAE